MKVDLSNKIVVYLIPLYGAIIFGFLASVIKKLELFNPWLLFGYIVTSSLFCIFLPNSFFNAKFIHIGISVLLLSIYVFFKLKF